MTFPSLGGGPGAFRRRGRFSRQHGLARDEDDLQQNGLRHEYLSNAAVPVGGRLWLMLRFYGGMQ